MKVIRAWPKEFPIEPKDRAFVTDSIPQYRIEDFNYRPLFEESEDSLLLIEWDIAFHKATLRRFLWHIAEALDVVHVAPYLFDNSSRYCVFREPGKESLCYTEGYFCNTFGFGMTYIPNDLRKTALDDLGDRINDGNFSQWHYEYICQLTRVHWDCEPVHLNYDIEDLL